MNVRHSLTFSRSRSPRPSISHTLRGSREPYAGESRAMMAMTPGEPTAFGNRQGHCVLEHSNGDMYDGLEGNLRNGFGVLHQYGQWKENKPSGQGTLTGSQSSEVYVGTFENGEFHGEGILTHGDVVIQGTWKHGKLNGSALKWIGTSKVFSVLYLDGNVLTSTEVDVSMMGVFHAKALQTICELVQQRDLAPNQLGGRRNNHQSSRRNSLTPAFASARKKSERNLRKSLPPALADVPPVMGPDAPRIGGATAEHTLSQSIEHLLVVGGPPPFSCRFRITKCVLHFFMHLVPFPFIPGCWLAPSAIAEERAYVVSGAVIGTDFGTPRRTLINSLMCFSLILAMLVCWGTSNLPRLQTRTTVSRYDILGPLGYFTLYSMLCAVQTSFPRRSHSLERIGSRSFPALVRVVNECVLPFSKVCVYYWDEEGYFFSTKAWFKRLWILKAVVTGSFLAVIPIITRVGMSDGALVNTSESLAVAAQLLSICSIAWTGGSCTYLLANTIDTQRHVLAQVSVLSRSARVNGDAVANPCDNTPVEFELCDTNDTACLSLDDDEGVPVRDVRGFQSWWLCRSFILYASVASNHDARGAIATTFLAFFVIVILVIFGDTLHFLAVTGHKDPITTSHTVALFLLVVWGHMLLYYLQVSSHIHSHLRTHSNLLELCIAKMESTSRAIENSQNHAALLRTHVRVLGMNDVVPKVLSVQINMCTLLWVASILYSGIGILVFRMVFPNVN